MATFNLETFLARSTDKPFEETTLSVILADLPELSKQGPWIAGGALRRTLLGQEPESDFDFFFRDADQLEGFVTELVSAGMIKVRETQHHVHYRGRVGGMDRDIQCIRFAFYKSAEEVIESFDYTLCMFAFDGETLTAGEYSLWDLGRGRLAVHKLTYPVASMRRLIKYTSQGFKACKGALSAILQQTARSPALLEQIDVEYVD